MDAETNCLQHVLVDWYIWFTDGGVPQSETTLL